MQRAVSCLGIGVALLLACGTESARHGSPLPELGEVPPESGDPDRSAWDAGAGRDAGPAGERVEAGPPVPMPEAGAAGCDSDGARAGFMLVGRADRRDPAGPRIGWPGAEIRARFSGAGLELRMADSRASHYEVEIDGVSAPPLIVTGAARPYTITSGLSSGVHEVVLRKRTESFVGVTQVLGVRAIDGVVCAPHVSPGERVRRIELVGDSITCGYGVLGANGRCPFTADTESEPRAWGALAARALSAAHSTVAVSGIGVLRNYGGERTETMPLRYGRALADDPTSAWDHSFSPDVVVVNLGTNDFAGGKGDPGEDFVTAYLGLLAAIRASHPDAHVVLATSPMLSEPSRSTLRRYVDAVVSARRALGDAQVSVLELPEQTDADGYGCDWHPSSSMQQAMATRLVGHLRDVLGW